MTIFVHITHTEMRIVCENCTDASHRTRNTAGEVKEVIIGNLLKLTCDSGLRDSRDNWIYFTLNGGEVIYCKPNLEEEENYRDWVLYRNTTNGDCVLEKNESKLEDKGEYHCGMLVEYSDNHFDSIQSRSLGVSVAATSSQTEGESAGDSTAIFIIISVGILFVVIVTILGATVAVYMKRRRPKDAPLLPAQDEDAPAVSLEARHNEPLLDAQHQRPRYDSTNEVDRDQRQDEQDAPLLPAQDEDALAVSLEARQNEPLLDAQHQRPRYDSTNEVDRDQRQDEQDAPLLPAQDEDAPAVSLEARQNEPLLDAQHQRPRYDSTNEVDRDQRQDEQDAPLLPAQDEDAPAVSLEARQNEPLLDAQHQRYDSSLESYETASEMSSSTESK